MCNYLSIVFVFGVLTLECCSSKAEVEATALPPWEVEQVEATVKQLYSLSYVDATCVLSKVDDAGTPIDRAAKSKTFREREYQKIFKPLLSSGLYAEMKAGCVSPDADGMLDLRFNDDSISSYPQYGNSIVLQVTRPIRVALRARGRVSAVVYWSEFYGPKVRKPAMSGRTDLVLVKEDGRWLIDDAFIAVFDPNLPDDSHSARDTLNAPLDKFESDIDSIGVVHYRKLPLSCSKGKACK